MKEPRMIAKTTRPQTVVAADLLGQWRRRKRWERASAGRGAPVIRLQGTNIGEKKVAFQAAALQNRRVRRCCQPLGALKELRVSGESEKEEELTQTELEFPSSPTNPTVETGATGQPPRLMKLQFGAVEQSTALGTLVTRETI
jgi:hypothetical protein